MARHPAATASVTPWTEPPPSRGRGRLAQGQFFWIIFLAMFPTMVMLLPGDLVRLGGRGAWWTPLVAAVPALALLWLLVRLAAPLGDPRAVALRVLGPVLGRTLLLAEWLALGAYVVVVVREAAEISQVTLVIANVPVWLLAACMLVPSGLLVWLGPVVLGRTASLVGPILVLMFLIVLGSVLPAIHALWARPLLPRDARFIAWRPLLETWVWDAEPLFLGLALLTHLHPTARRVAGPTLELAMGTSSLLTALGTWMLLALLGPHGAAGLQLPALELVNRITFGPFVQHLQSFVLPIEAMGTALKLAVFLWVWARLGEAITGAPLRVCLLVEAGLGLGLGMGLFPNVLGVDEALYLWLAVWAMPLLVGSLLLTYTVAALRGAATQGG